MADRPSVGEQYGQGFVARHVWAPYLLLTMTMVFFSGSILVGRVIREDIPPLGLVFWRNVVAAAVLLPFMVPRLRVELPMLVRHWKVVVVLGITNSLTGQALLLLSLHTSTAINVGLIHATQPVIILTLAWVVLRDRVTLRQSIGVGVALIGVIAIVSRGQATILLTLDFVIGDLWILLAMVSWAIYAVLVKRVPGELHPFVLLLAIAATGGVVMLPFYLGEAVLLGATMPVNLFSVSTVLYYSVVNSILGIVFFNIGIAHIGPGRAGVFFYLVPVTTALGAVVLLGEEIQFYHLVGSMCALSGVYLAGRSAKPGAARK